MMRGAWRTTPRIKSQFWSQAQNIMLTIEEKIDRTSFVVYASDAERMFIWKLWNSVLKFEQDIQGTIIDIGYVARRPITIEMYWFIIEGHRVAFINGCSMLVDYAMIDDWVKRTFIAAGGLEKNRCDADNFMLCVETVYPNFRSDIEKITQFNAIEKLLTGKR